MNIKRRDFLKTLTGLALTGITSSGIECSIPVRDPNVKTAVLHLPCDWHSNGILTVGVWYDPNLMSSEGNPVVVSSPGFSASAIDLGSVHNALANEGCVVLAPDPEDIINFMGADMLKSYSGSQEFQDVINQFGSIDNYVRTLLFSPYLDLEEQEKGIINVNLEVIANLFIDVFNQVRTIPEYKNYHIRDIIRLAIKSMNAEVKDVRLNDLLGEALYGSRCKDISNLLDFSTGDNIMGNNPQGRNVLDERFKGGVKIDINRIGGLGYSLGGGTMLELLGAGDICNGNLYYDPRFSKSPVVLIAPTSALNHEENFPEIKNKILFFSGDGDFLVNGMVRRQPLLPNGEVITYNDTEHVTFSDTTCKTTVAEIFKLIPRIERIFGNCDSHEQLVPVRDKYLCMFFNREFGPKSAKQSDLIALAKTDPHVYFATDQPITQQEINEYFPDAA